MANKKENDSKKKGLGRGIEAIFGEENLSRSTDDVFQIDIDKIRANPYQPRTEFDEDALKDLSESIKQNGVFQPIILRESVNGYEVVAGERRLRASKLANKKTIPAIIRKFDDNQMLEIAVLENLQREDLSPLEEAEAYETLMNKLNITQEEVSKRLGKSRPYIANYLRLLNLPDKTKGYLRDGKLSMGQARTLLGLKDKSKIDQIAKETIEEGLTVRQLEKVVNQANEGSQKTLTQKTIKKSPFVRASEDELINKFDTKVEITESKKGNGKITINYDSVKDLNRILDILDVDID